jgi:DNA/RNA-binding domain of Phe-tRNA-synthetase-like protein
VHRDEAVPTLPLTIAEEIASRIRVGSFTLEGVTAGERPASLDRELQELESRYRRLWKEPADAHDALHPARKLYHALGIDPSKTRPSSEALLRRVLLQKELYKVNAVVDAANLASLSLLLPVGLYDLEKIRPPVDLRFGRDGESYEGIRKDEVHLHGRPTLVDSIGAFGNPTSDSLRTSVSAETRAVWFVLFAPPDYPEPSLRDELRRAREILRRHACGGAGIA